MKFPTQLNGDYFINHETRIPIKEPGFNGKYPSFFFCGSDGLDGIVCLFV